MNSDQRDTMMIEMHGNVKVLVARSDDHHETLYGKDGVVDSIVLLRERQDQCPARQANTIGGKRLGIAYVMMILGVLTAVVGVIAFFLK